MGGIPYGSWGGTDLPRFVPKGGVGGMVGSPASSPKVMTGGVQEPIGSQRGLGLGLGFPEGIGRSLLRR